MISCAFGMFCSMMNELTVGMITSLLPFTTSVGWLIDFKIAVGSRLLNAPLVHRFNLGGRNLFVHLGITPLPTKMLALQELLSRRLARR